jgi:hypothetical protein
VHGNGFGFGFSGWPSQEAILVLQRLEIWAEKSTKDVGTGLEDRKEEDTRRSKWKPTVCAD